MKISLKGSLYTLISLLLTVVILGSFLSQISPGEVLNLIREADLGGVLMFLVLSFTMNIFRTWRYRLLLGLSGYAPPRFSMFMVVLVRNLFSDLLPARVGTLAYVAVVTTRLGVPMQAALNSWAYSFVFDMLAVTPLVILAAFITGGSTMLSVPALIGGSLVLALIVSIAILLLPKFFRIAATLIERMPLLSAGTKSSLGAQLKLTESEVVRTRDQGVFLRLLFLSAMVRIFKYGGLYMFLYALLRPMGFTLSQLEPNRVFLGILAAELAASLPISGIAGFGVYQGAWALVFHLLGFSEHIAKLTSLSHHIFTQAYGYLLGIGAMLVLMLPFLKLQDSSLKQPRRRENAFAFYGLMLGVCLTAALLCRLAYQTFPYTQSFQQFSADQPDAAQLQLRSQISAQLPGTIVFDSNRSGTFGIYTIHPDGSGIETIADGPQHEMYPDPSPDGNFIAYAVALSLQRNSPSEIWIKNLNDGTQRRITEDGTFPTFSRDGSKIFFERGRESVYSFDLLSGKEALLFPLKPKDFKYQIVMPRLSSDQSQVCFTSDRKGRWNVWCADLKTQKSSQIAHGCEPSWLDNGDVLWVSTTAVRERSGIYGYNPAQDRSYEVQDGDAPRGHEYFPTMTPDGKFLLFGACSPDQHSHEDSNYQLFIKAMDSGVVARLTFDAFNNRWPKLLMRAGAR